MSGFPVSASRNLPAAIAPSRLPLSQYSLISQVSCVSGVRVMAQHACFLIHACPLPSSTLPHLHAVDAGVRLSWVPDDSGWALPLARSCSVWALLLLRCGDLAGLLCDDLRAGQQLLSLGEAPGMLLATSTAERRIKGLTEKVMSTLGCWMLVHSMASRRPSIWLSSELLCSMILIATCAPFQRPALHMCQRLTPQHACMHGDQRAAPHP
jgi:hypothetical protein